MIAVIYIESKLKFVSFLPRNIASCRVSYPEFIEVFVAQASVPFAFGNRYEPTFIDAERPTCRAGTQLAPANAHVTLINDMHVAWNFEVLYVYSKFEDKLNVANRDRGLETQTSWTVRPLLYQIPTRSDGLVFCCFTIGEFRFLYVFFFIVNWCWFLDGQQMGYVRVHIVSYARFSYMKNVFEYPIVSIFGERHFLPYVMRLLICAWRKFLNSSALPKGLRFTTGRLLGSRSVGTCLSNMRTKPFRMQTLLRWRSPYVIRYTFLTHCSFKRIFSSHCDWACCLCTQTKAFPNANAHAPVCGN